MTAQAAHVRGQARPAAAGPACRARAQPHQTSASWATPATGTDQICQRPMSPPVQQPISRKAIITRFIRIGAAAGEREAAERVQHAGEQGGQRDEQDVGEGDAAVLDREREALVAGEAAGHGEHQPGHGDQADEDEEDQHGGEAGERVAGEALGVLAGLDLLGEHRHEGEVEGALGEEAAEHVGQGEGDQEGLRHRAGAEEGGHQDVAREAEHAAEHRPGADAQERRQQPDRADHSAPSDARRWPPSAAPRASRRLPSACSFRPNRSLT